MPCSPLFCARAIVLGIFLGSGPLLPAWQGSPAEDAEGGGEPEPRLTRVLQRLSAPVTGNVARFRYTLRASRDDVPLGLLEPRAPEPAGRAGAESAEAVIEVLGPDAFTVRVTSPWITLTFDRTAERTVLALPGHGVAFVGEGDLGADDDSTAPRGFLKRMAGLRLPVFGLALNVAARKAGTLDRDDRDGVVRWKLDDATRLALGPEGVEGVVLTSTATSGLFDGVRRLEVRFDESPSGAAVSLDGLTVKPVPRAGIERMVFRAVRRALSVRLHEELGVAPPAARKVPHGEVRIVDGQAVALLSGTPEEIGAAHGQLLGDNVIRTLDSVLHLAGLVETCRSGAWFPDVLRSVWERLEPHIPERHLREMEALAKVLPRIPAEDLRLAHVFPEFFHCSGFAVFGKATADGTLYHGRVLDYMTAIGLQQGAVLFVVQPEGRHAFASAGYAGFIGSVTGMNDVQISLGEMGGGGGGLWDGVPMAMLMRRALEECSTLDEVCDLWRRSPRTCEYFYVFADGKIPSAVGVAATPDRLEFVRPGEDQELLGPGIEDAVVLSVGDRLSLLRQRVRAGHGRIDAEAALRLMDRPVAMSSNLHNVLMVPEKAQMWVAHAESDQPAAERPYVCHELGPLFAGLAEARAPEAEAPPAGAGTVEGTFGAKDSLAPGEETSDDARALLDSLRYEPRAFEVRVAREDGPFDALVRFPSPKPSGDARNDDVAMEWHRARGVQDGGSAPAVIVLHILGADMRLARHISRRFATGGVHAFLMYLPGYGTRGTREQRRDVSTFFSRAVQAGADARRARDAAASLPGVDPRRIGIQGTSLGGFVAATAAAIDCAFDPVLLCLAGGDLGTMLQSGEKDVARIRDALAAAGIRGEDLRRLARSFDPLRIAHRLDPARTWMWNARSDEVVPRACSEALARAAGLGSDHHLWLPGTHYSCLPFLPLVQTQMLARVLGDPESETAPAAAGSRR